MAAGDLTAKIVEFTHLKVTDVKRVPAALQTNAYSEVEHTGKFVIPKLLTRKLRHKPLAQTG